MNFNELKKQSKTSIAALTEKLLKETETVSGGGYADDLDLFKLETDKSGNGRAIIRFLPAPAGEEKSFVRLYNHGFQVNGKWLIENCPTTIGETCPICESNSNYWHSGDERTARARKRKLSFYANVYIVSNPANRELEGTVKIFRFGQKILDKIRCAAKPEFEGDPEIHAFNFWEGANFRLICKTIKTKINGEEKSMPNYDDSIFEEKSEFLNGDDDLLEDVYNRLHSLEAIVDKSKFKSYEDLEKKLNMVAKFSSKSFKPSVEDQERELDEMLSPKEDILKELEDSYTSMKESSTEDEDDEDIRRFMALAES